jgi:hypothetical protein
MDTKFFNMPEADNPIVYVSPVRAEDLPDELRSQVGDLEVVYAVSRTNGERLALVASKKLAFALAREHDFDPVSVH